MVVAERPPDVSVDDITRVFGGKAARTVVMRNPVGHDGWVEDVVVVVRPQTEALEAMGASRPAIRRMVDDGELEQFEPIFQALGAQPRPPSTRDLPGKSHG